jgi:predicted nucleic acid-binding protein
VIVIDASVLADALTDDGDVGEQARTALTKDDHWVAPDHLIIEVMSVIRGRHLGGKLTDDRATGAVRALGQLVIDRVDLVPSLDRIWQLRANLTPYDAGYVAVAEVFACPLVTADRKLAAAVPSGFEVHLLTPVR